MEGEVDGRSKETFEQEARVKPLRTTVHHLEVGR